MKKFIDMTDSEKKKLSEMSGKLMVWIQEKRSVNYMATQLNLEPRQVDHNIEEMLYELKNYVGIKRFLKVLFWK